MGFDPKDVSHLNLAYRNGLGDINLRNMRISGRSPQAERQEFQRGNLYKNPFGNIEIIYGKDVPAGYLNALSHSLERLRFEGRTPKDARVYVGRFEGKNVEQESVVFGDVTNASVVYSGQNVISGNPPRAFDLYALLNQ